MNKLKLIKKNYSDIKKDVYDIEVQNEHNYILDNGIVSHNSGLVYASSIVVLMQKYKLKEDEDGKKTTTVNGIRAKCKVSKTRYAKPFEEIEIHIPYDTGMNIYSGLTEMFEKYGLLAKSGNRLCYVDIETQEQIIKYRKDWIKNVDNCLDLIMKQFDNHQSMQKISSESNDIDMDNDDASEE